MDPISAVALLAGLAKASPELADLIHQLISGKEPTAADHDLLTQAVERSHAGLQDAVARYRQRHGLASPSAPAELDGLVQPPPPAIE